MTIFQYPVTIVTGTAWEYSSIMKVMMMSRSYLTEDAKMAYSPFPRWTIKQCLTIHEKLLDKGYIVNCVSRVGCDRRYHDAWEVEREDIPRLIEQLFRQRIVVEVQAEGSYKASINFVYDYSAETIIDAVERFQRKREESE